MSRLSKPQRVPLLCYVTDLRAISSRESGGAGAALLEKVAAAAAAGVDWIQIREKHLPAKECAALVREALQCVANSPSSRNTQSHVIVNDRLDVALAAHADGVHLAENGLPPHEARQLARQRQREEDFLLGVSCHSLAAAKSAADAGADYVFFGPVFATPSKAAYGAPQGLERLAEVCRAVSVPVLAIGGITLENCSACLSAGAAGIAAIRLFQDETDLPGLVQSLRKASA
ncbi:MAG TPA: thiamine phosphate synthase [Candidatus Angelobacter sp.]|nr:thiamine phosphate synthase [Candidatus Angelobacter sp.]